MILHDEKLKSNDKIFEKDGHLVITRPITFYLCRCRECSDACSNLVGIPDSLGDQPLIGYAKMVFQTGSPLCSLCNNNCSQRKDPNDYFSQWIGPHTGPRKTEELNENS
jgi:hypothetical protein